VIIRVWLENEDTQRGLRARITWVRDLQKPGQEEVFVASSIDEIMRIVRRCVDTFTKVT
jgi:hypothetical protein